MKVPNTELLTDLKGQFTETQTRADRTRGQVINSKSHNASTNQSETGSLLLNAAMRVIITSECCSKFRNCCRNVRRQLIHCDDRVTRRGQQRTVNEGELLSNTKQAEGERQRETEREGEPEA